MPRHRDDDDDGVPSCPAAAEQAITHDDGVPSCPAAAEQAITHDDADDDDACPRPRRPAPHPAPTTAWPDPSADGPQPATHDDGGFLPQAGPLRSPPKVPSPPAA